MTTPVYLGVDAGNSKTVALVCDASGEVLGWGRAGSGDVYGALTACHAVDAVVSAVTTALDGARMSAGRVTGAALALAGVDWPEDAALWQRAMADRLPLLPPPSIRNDGFAPIRCARPDGIGVAVVAGTGPAVAGRGPGGQTWALSWWAQDDLGASGLGGAALRAVFRAEIGLGPATALTGALLERYAQPDVEALLHEFTRREQRRSWQDKAIAARQVLAAARDGDAVAAAIVSNQGRAFARYARVAADRAGFDTAHDAVPVVLAGSVLSADDSPLLDALRVALAAELPRSTAELTRLPPVVGAVLDAVAEAGDATAAPAGALVDPAVAETLRRTLPAGAYVQT